MTVRELVERLQALDQDLIVAIPDECDEPWELSKVRQTTLRLGDYSGSPTDPKSGYGVRRDVLGVLLS